MVDDGSLEPMTVSTLPTDERLWSDWRLGDRSALDEIVRRHEDRLARIAYRITGCRHAAEDVRHAAFVQLLQSPAEIRNIGAWLTRCTVHEAVTRVRRRDREGRAIAGMAQLTRATDDSPMQRAQQEETRERLAIALEQLTPDDRALLSLRFDEDLTFREIAEVLDRPVSTVKSQVSYAIARLRELLGANLE
jgi:RNA polymerase sigma-70 factor (ECF subfamily)